MPPLEAKKFMFRRVAGVRGWRRRRGEEEEKLMFIDVRKAHLNAKCDEEEWVELPEDFKQYGRFARLRRWLYGMRKAASGWEEDYSDRLLKIGFIRGKSASTVFWNKNTGVRIVVHGDDFTMSGTRKALMGIKEKLEEWYDIKFRGIMGSEADEIKAVTILGRRLRWTQEGLEYEGDPKHRQELIKKSGLTEESKAAVSATVKETGGLEDDDTRLEEEEARKCRGEIALLNYMGQDRTDVQYAANQVSKMMANPTEETRRRIKRIARYLVGVENMVWKYGEIEGEEKTMNLDMVVDSDWAKEKDRKSTSGG